jgi:hypothetical protein
MPTRPSRPEPKSQISHAALFDRGGGLIYDDVLDITWLQDTNYALTNGDNDGMMDWYEANTWVAGLSYYDAVRDVTYDDWRLPTMSPIDGNIYNTTETNNATSDAGYARTTTDGSDGGWRDISGTPVSEFGYMYYVNLGNFGRYHPDSDPCNIQSGWGLNNIGLFTNFSHLEIETEDSLGRYATGTEFDETGTSYVGDYAWNFNLLNGEQILRRKGAGFDRLAAWAVRDGDVLSTPLRCDLNGNGKTDAGDLSQVLRMVAGIIPGDLDCDLNNGGFGDGIISTADIVIVSRIVLGIIPAIPN